MRLQTSELPGPIAEDAAPEKRRKLTAAQRRAVWVAALAATLAVLVLTPPLINANRYRRKIAESMSRSLGRPVHLDNVALHLLPVPGFTLTNLVVSEDPAFGAEPTIRANTVEATLRVSSLWHRPVEFSTVRFVEPSVNLVRDSKGRWNLSDVLLHASRVDSAPTAQPHAGPAPRFPYIEATGGRVNIKLGPEKLPFSLTDARLALWLPSARQWRVRLDGQPVRTDANITDSGRLRIEGQLHRAPTADEVPLQFNASWHDAPLGDATRILTGEDQGWRGTLNFDAVLSGTLGNAGLQTSWSLGGLRRSGFVPPHPLDLHAVCDSGVHLRAAALEQLRCTLPDNAPEPAQLDVAQITADTLHTAPLHLSAQNVPVRWALLWAAMFSQTIPRDRDARGQLDVDVQRALSPVTPVTAVKAGRHRLPAAPNAAAPAWSGMVQLRFPAGLRVAGTPASSTTLVASVVSPEVPGQHPSLSMAPQNVDLGADGQVLLSGTVSSAGYGFTVAGTAAPVALLHLGRYLPPMAENVAEVLPQTAPASTPVPVGFTCQRLWEAQQTCGPLAAPAPGSRSGPASRRRHGRRSH